MGRGRDWTVSEERWLIEHAGRIPKREICEHLKRGSRAVEAKARRLRQAGVSIQLRHHATKLQTCPSCGCARATCSEIGICEVCRRKARLERVQGAIAVELAKLPASARAVYERTEAEIESRVPGNPPQLKIDPDAPVHVRDRAIEAHARAVERWEVDRLKRQIRAAQKRKERIAARQKT